MNLTKKTASKNVKSYRFYGYFRYWCLKIAKFVKK